jgi:hypothetical protein
MTAAPGGICAIRVYPRSLFLVNYSPGKSPILADIN